MKRKADIEWKDDLDAGEIEKINTKIQKIADTLSFNVCTTDQIYGQYCLNHIRDLVEIVKTETVNIAPTDFFIKETWPSKTPTEVKVRFLNTVGLLTFKTHGPTIAKYIRTLEDLFSNEDGSFAYNIQCIYTNGNKSMEMNQRALQQNLAFCCHLDPKQNLSNTSFATLERIAFFDRIKQLQIHNRENIGFYQQIVAVCNARTQKTPLPHLYPEPSITPLDDVSNEDDIELLPHQRLEEFLLNYAASHGLRKSATGIYVERVCMPQHTQTNYFDFHADFLEWMYEVVGSYETHRFETFALTKNYITPKQVVDFLANTKDPRLPFIKKRRTLFSYSNGIFDAKTGRFHLYSKLPNDWNQNLSDYNVGFIDELQSDEQSANFFNVDIELRYFHKDFKCKNIETPYFDKILIDQGFGNKDMKWYHFSLGRLQHDVGSMDNFQVCHFNIGVAGSGKSTILGKYAEIYDATDVGTIMDDAEQKFTDQHLHNAFLVVGADVSKEISVSSARFNSWVSGDSLTINLKHKTAISMKWKAPMCYGSNEFPGIKSKAGSGARRFLFFMFNYAIIDGDPQLPGMLTDELPKYAIKCALQYRKYAIKYKNQSLWERKKTGKKIGEYILPKMCHDAKKEYVSKTSVPDAFLDSSVCEFDKTAYKCTKKQLVEAYEFFLSQLASRTQGALYARKSPEACTPNNFNYALSMRNCKWDAETNIITGLRINGGSGPSTTGASTGSSSYDNAILREGRKNVPGSFASSSASSSSSSFASNPALAKFSADIVQKIPTAF